jgi:Fe-S oxidoreductase
VMDFMEFIAPRLPEPEVKSPLKVTIHNPCHMTWSGTVAILPDLIAKRFDYIRQGNVDACCGSGGMFGFKHGELSKAIAARRTAPIISCGADVVVAECPGCIMQLRDCLAAEGWKGEVLHPAVLLADRCGNTKRGM